MPKILRALEQRTAAATEQRTVTAELRDVRTEGRTLHGHAALYGVESRPIEDRQLGTFTETIRAGAFADALAGAPDICLTFNHDPSRVLARTSSGTLRIRDEERGLAFEADLGDGPTAQDVRDMVSRGDVRGASFRFRVAPDGEEWDGERRTLTRIEHLADLSLATTPAYDGPGVELRSLPERRGSLTVESRSALTSATATEVRTSATLRTEERMLDWQARRRTRSSLTVEEAREFSLGRAVRGMVTGDWQDAGMEQRALAEAVNSTGGFVVPEIVSAQVIDLIRNQAQVLNAGATVVPMESDAVSIPRLAAAPVAHWKVENAAVVDSDPAFERVRLVAHTLPVLTKVSVELFQDMTPAASDRISNALVSAIALELDRAALRGSGVSPEPLGLRGQPGVELRPMGGANGASPTAYSDLVRAVAALRGRNVSANAVIHSSRTAESYALLVDTLGQPLEAPAYLGGLQFLESNQIPDNQTTGTSTDTSEIYVGRFSDMLIGVRPSIGVRVRQLNERFMDSMQIGLLAWIRADVQLAHAESFSIIQGVRP